MLKPKITIGSNLSAFGSLARLIHLAIQVGKNVISFSQAEFTKLPKYMLESERIKFSTEQRQLLLSPEKKPSKFFLRWVNDAIFPDSIKEKMEEIKNR